MVNLIEVVFATPETKGVAPDPGLFKVRGYEVGGRTMVVAVALGTLPPVKGVALLGGLDVVKTVTLFITAKLTDPDPVAAPLPALGTANRGRLVTWPALMGVAEVAVFPRQRKS